MGQLLAESGKCLKQVATRDDGKTIDSFVLFDCGALSRIVIFFKIELLVRDREFESRTAYQSPICIRDLAAECGFFL